MAAASDAVRFRPRWALRVMVAVSCAFWAAVVAAGPAVPSIPASTFFAAALAIYFGVSLLFYNGTAIHVDESGLTYRSPLRTCRVRWEEVKTLAVFPGLVTSYLVVGRGETFGFNGFFAHHRTLRELIESRLSSRPR